MRILVIRNEFAWSLRGFDTFADWMKRKTGVKPVFTYKDTAIRLKFKDLWNGGNKWGIDDVRGVLRANGITGKGYDLVAFVYNKSKYRVPGDVFNFAHPDNGFGCEVVEISMTAQKAKEATYIPLKLSHEAIHCWYLNLAKKGIQLLDTMDSYRHNDEMEHPQGNREENLARLRPYFPILFAPPANQPEKIIVHHTAVSRAKAPLQFKATDDYHKAQFNFRSSLGYYGGYHLFIEPNGTVLRYRLDTEEGAHTLKENKRSLAVCLTGNFDVEMPTPAQIEALRGVLSKWWASYSPLPIFPHRKFAAYKSCYGSLLSEDWASLVIEPLKPADPAKEERFKQYSAVLEAARQLLIKLQGRL